MHFLETDIFGGGIFITVGCLFIYLFITERCTEGKLVTQWAKNLSHWVTSFRHWVTSCHPVVVLKDALMCPNDDVW